MFVKISQKNIHYEVLGNGQPIVFVHGWGGNLEVLKKLSKDFLETHKCFYLDLPGFGKSSNPDKDWGVEGYADVLIEFIEKIIKQQVIYCGYSFGGGLGIYLAKNTKLIKKMVLIAPAYKRGNLKKTSLSRNKLYLKLKKYIFPIRKVFYRIFFPDSQALLYPHLEENFKKIVSQDLSDNIDKMDVDTLILCGKEDSFINIEDIVFLNKNLKSSQLKMYDNIEHNLPIVNFEEVGNDILGFLQK